MNKSKLLILLSSPIVLASALLVANPVYANESVVQLQPKQAAVSTPTSEPVFEVEFEQQETPDAPMVEFTEEEASTAVQRFGCDCTSCINSVRQLQGKLPLL